MTVDYGTFIDRKSHLGDMGGFAPVWMPDFLFDFQRALVEWAIRKGRAAIFADCGLGKTPMQLVWAENVVRHTNRPVLILTPLAVAGQTIREAEKFGIQIARSHTGQVRSTIVVTNYERLHHFDPADFAGVVCDESSILKHFSGATQSAVTRFMLKIPYRLLCTATAAPNDYIELGTSSQALGELGYSDMLSRFFKQSDNKMHRMQQIRDQRREKLNNHFGKLSFRVSQQIGQWHLKGHAVEPFWRWIASWARACRKPSDLGFPDDGFALPPLTERGHMIVPQRPPDGMLLTLPAIGLNEEREERRRTLTERCELVAKLVGEHNYSMIWCHLNIEGETLERMIPYSINVQGSDDDDYKETAASWFKGEICICGDHRFSDKLASWQKGRTDIGNDFMRPTESGGLLNQLNMGDSIEAKRRPICAPTTLPIKTNGPGVPEKNRTRSTQPNARSMPLTPSTASEQKLNPENGWPQTHASVSINGCENTASLPTITTACLPSNTGGAPSVAAGQETNEQSAFTSIIATQPEPSEDCFAQTAILASVSLGIASSGLSEPRCICGHKHGPRRLISKAKIFGFGLNLQFCNHVVTFASHSYEQYYQSIRRCWRFGQERPVTVDIISTEGEARVKDNMTRKALAADQMFAELVAHMNDGIRLSAALQPINVEIPRWLS